MNIFLVVVMLTTVAPSKIPCVMIRPFISTYGYEAVDKWARAHGYSDVEITEVTKRCLVKHKRNGE